MYLPLEPTFLHLLQLPFSWFSSTPQTSTVRPDRRSDVYDLGNISPYHDAPAFHGVLADLPGDCTVDQVILLHRHGSRGPVMVVEEQYILQLVNTLNGAWEAIQEADLPKHLQFLKDGYEYQLVPQELTRIGRKELFDHGVQFALRYPTFSTDVIITTTVQRVIDSAHFFAQGFFGREAENVTFLTSDDVGEVPSWLTTWEYCPNISYDEGFEVGQRWIDRYIPPIMARLDDLVPGVGFSSDDIHGALYACPYDLAARGDSPWCDVFTQRELQGFEYELDLMLDRWSGYLARGDPAPYTGAFYIKKLIERLTEGSERLYLDFGHDFTMLFALSTMGLNKDPFPLSPTHLQKHRKFRSSYQTPFAANMIWEKFSCQTSFNGPQVRLILNGVTFPLSFCQKSDGDHTYGTCSLDNFVQANAYSMNVEYQDKFWNATCEVPK